MTDSTKPAADEVKVSAPTKPARGAQVILGGDAQAAARGGAAGDLMGNLLAKRALEADGTVADGYSADGTSVTGRRQMDDHLSEEAQNTPSGEKEETRVTVENPEAAAEAQAPDGLGGTSETPSPEPDDEPEPKQRGRPKKA